MIVYSRLFLGAQHFLFASHSEKLAIFIRAPFFERSVFYSRDNLKRSRFFIRVSSFVRSVFYSQVMLKTRNLYSRAFLSAQRFLFARQSEHSRSLFARADFVQKIRFVPSIFTLFLEMLFLHLSPPVFPRLHCLLFHYQWHLSK